MISPPNIKSVEMAAASVSLTQPNDTEDRGDTGQYLRVEVCGGIASEAYLVICTERWAIDFDEIDNLCAWLKGLEPKQGGTDD